MATRRLTTLWLVAQLFFKLSVASLPENIDVPERDRAILVGRAGPLGRAQVILDALRDLQDDTEDNEDLVASVQDSTTDTETTEVEGSNVPKSRQKRTTIMTNTKNWPKCIVPYAFRTGHYTEPRERAAVLRGLDIYNRLTGFRFVPFTGDNSVYGLDHDAFAAIEDKGNGSCASSLGFRNNINGQFTKPCLEGHIARHELGHLLGVLHEQEHPDSMKWLDIPNGGHNRRATHDVVNHSFFYDPASILHYRHSNMVFHDEDDDYYVDLRSTYYLFKDLETQNNCFEQFPSCATPPECANGGYAAVIDGTCQCRCPKGLDRATNCQTESMTAKATNWPVGKFTLFKSSLGPCPEGFEAGSMVHWPYRPITSGGTHQSPPFDAIKTEHDVCTKTVDTGRGSWPPGKYCVMRKGGSCQTGFTEGTMTTYGIDGRDGYDQVNNGTLPDGNLNREFEYKFCCRSDGRAVAKLDLNLADNIILFPTSRNCQAVEGAESVKEFFEWKNDPSRTIEKSGDLPRIITISSTKVRVYYCVYTPAKQETNWPVGTFSLLKTTVGPCPPGFETGSMVHWHGKRLGVRVSHHSPGFDKYKMEHDVCTKTDASAGNGDWISGEFCVLRKGGSCPTGFKKGVVKTDGAERPSNYNEVNEGILPDGSHTANDFRYITCCKEDVDSWIEQDMNLVDPIILLSSGVDCQHIKDAYHKEEWLVWNNDEGVDIITEGIVPYQDNKTYGPDQIKLLYCVYVPLKKGHCGEIKTLTQGEGAYTFSTPFYPNNYPLGDECYWRFESPEGTTIQLDFNDFNIPPETDGSCGSFVEIRDWHPGTEGFEICGEDYQKTHWSKLNHLTVRFVSPWVTGRGFSATVTVIDDNSRCYNGDGTDGSYAGTVNYGKRFEPCMRWDQVLDCPFNQFDPRTINEDLTGHNYCRAVGNTVGPWCYKNADCERQMCDACQLGKCFDIFTDCADIMSSDPTFCTADGTISEASRGCRDTCGLCAPQAHPVSDVMCGTPEAVGNIQPDEPTQYVYSVGDKVTYTCSGTQVKRTRTCTSEGEWTALKKVCDACPTGWYAFNQRCYTWLGYDTGMNQSDAIATCSGMATGARLPSGQSEDELAFLKSVVEYNILDPGPFWIGMERNVTDETWVNTADGSVTTVDFWEEDEPGGQWKKCAVVSEGWQSIRCSDLAYVICELQIPDGCVNVRSDCSRTLSDHPDMCTRYPEYAWHNCRRKCRLSDECISKRSARDTEHSSFMTCVDDATVTSQGSVSRIHGADTIRQGEYLEYVCNAGYFHTSGQLMRACDEGKLTGQPPVCSNAKEASSVIINSDVTIKPRHHSDAAGRIITSNSREMSASIRGVITSWTIYSNYKGEVALLVLRPANGDSYTVRGVNVISPTVENRAMTYKVPTSDRVIIEPGDVIGMYDAENESSHSKCTGEESVWKTSVSDYEAASMLPAAGDVLEFSDLQTECRMYSLRYEIDPL